MSFEPEVNYIRRKTVQVTDSPNSSLNARTEIQGVDQLA